MELINSMYFTEANWLWAILILPVFLIAYIVSNNKLLTRYNLSGLADAHLLPHLVSKNSLNTKKNHFPFLLLNLIWFFLVIALAGPRWGFTQVASYKSSSSLVVVLDMADTMLAEDVIPNRFARAKQEILDINSNIQVINLGVIGFAKYSHIIVPLTEDRELIKSIIPVLDTKFIKFQGKAALVAITQAAQQLAKVADYDKSIVLITDGGLSATELSAIGKKINNNKINLFILGIGNKLNADSLKELAVSTNGVYQAFDPINEIYKTINKKLSFAHNNVNKEQAMVTIWNERFYLFLIPATILLLMYMLVVRREVLLIIIILGIAFPDYSYAKDFADYFKSREELALKQYNQRNYELAKDNFIDSYRQGVAAYRSGKYAEAEQDFKNSKRPEIAISALYNLGNSQALQDKLPEAVISYETVLAMQAEHAEAKENLQIVKDLLAQRKEEMEQNRESSQDKDNRQNQEQPAEQPKSQEPNKDQEQQQGQKQSLDETRDKQAEENIKLEQANQDQAAEQKEQDQQNNLKQPQAQTSAIKEAANLPDDVKSTEVIKADKWLNQLDNDLVTFLANKFYIEENIARREND